MATKQDRERRGGDVVDAADWLGGQKGGGGRMCYNIPSSVNRWQPDKPGTFLIDIGLYKTTKKHPTLPPGKRAPDLQCAVHRAIGPNKDWILCPGRTFKQKCFICEYRAKMGSSPDRDKDVEQALKDLMAKDRQLWNVFDHDDRKKGWQVHENSFHLFGKHIAAKIMNSRPNDRKRYMNFFMPGAAGMTLKITGNEESMGSNKFIDFTGVEFVERTPKVVTRLEEAGEPHALDTFLVVTPYAQVKKIVLAVGGGGEDDEEEEDADDDDDTDEVEDDEDADDDDDEADEGEDDEDDEGGDDETDDEDESEDDDDEDEEEAPRPVVGAGVVWKHKGGKLKGVVTAVKAKSKRFTAEDEDGEEYEDTPWSKIVKVTPPKKAEGKVKKRRDDEIPF